MRPGRSHGGVVETVEVLLEDEEEPPDEFLLLLHQLALEAIERRATWPGEPRVEVDPDAWPAAPVAEDRPRLIRRLGTARLVRWALIGAVVVAVLVARGVGDARDAAARLAALRADAGVLQPLADPSALVWAAAGPPVSDTARAQLAAGAASFQPVTYQDAELPSGSLVTWSWHADGESGQGRVTTSGPVRAVSLRGPPLVPALTDGSRPDTLVVGSVATDRLSAVDLRTGRMSWFRSFASTPPVRATAQVAGVLLLQGRDSVTAVDVRTGDTRWTAPVASTSAPGALTDGVLVLVPVRDGAGGLAIEARSIADGSVQWRVPAPEGTVALTVVDQVLVAVTGDGALAWAPAASSAAPNEKESET